VEESSEGDKSDKTVFESVESESGKSAGKCRYLSQGGQRLSSKRGGESDRAVEIKRDVGCEKGILGGRYRRANKLQLVSGLSRENQQKKGDIKGETGTIRIRRGKDEPKKNRPGSKKKNCQESADWPNNSKRAAIKMDGYGERRGAHPLNSQKVRAEWLSFLKGDCERETGHASKNRTAPEAYPHRGCTGKEGKAASAKAARRKEGRDYLRKGLKRGNDREGA